MTQEHAKILHDMGKLNGLIKRVKICKYSNFYAVDFGFRITGKIIFKTSVYPNLEL